MTVYFDKDTNKYYAELYNELVHLENKKSIS